MSSTQSPSSNATSTPTASPSPSQSNNSGNQDGGNTSNSLYLFTFLTTLLLLLAVSCGIVLRSFILRRRFRRRVEAAIAAGVLLPEQVEALRRRGPPVGERPTMWEVYIEGGGKHKEGYEPSSSVNAPGPSEQLDDWANVMPVSAVIVPAGSKRTSGNSTPLPVPVPQPARDEGPLSTTRSSRLGLWPFGAPPQSAAPILPVTAPPPAVPFPEEQPGTAATIPISDPPENHDKLQLTVLIAMPNANAPQYIPEKATSVSSLKGKESSESDDDDDDEEEEIPEVVFGLTEVIWTGGVDWRPTEAEKPAKKSEDTEDAGNSQPLPPGA